MSYEGQVNGTQQEYNLLGQRVVCQYIYIYIYLDFESLYKVKYKLEWTIENERKTKVSEWTKNKFDEAGYSFGYYLKLIHI